MRLSPFARASWAALFYNLAVIVWGAYVRASGSGAGCGRHWPLCNGEVVPRMHLTETVIELSHRVTSGAALVAIVWLAVWAHRSFPRNHVLRVVTRWNVVFIMGEALIGALLVLFEWVAHSTSWKRAIAMPLHLTNTFFLLGSLALTAFWASGGRTFRLRSNKPASWTLGVCFMGVLLLGATGALAALGDTLFPSATLREGLARDFGDRAAHILVRLRVFHPVLAAVVAVYTLGVATVLRAQYKGRAVSRYTRAVYALVVCQVAVGFLNLVLLVPIPLQLLHLLLADLLWVALVLLAANVLGAEGELEAPVRWRSQAGGIVK